MMTLKATNEQGACKSYSGSNKKELLERFKSEFMTKGFSVRIYDENGKEVFHRTYKR